MESQNIDNTKLRMVDKRKSIKMCLLISIFISLSLYKDTSLYLVIHHAATGNSREELATSQPPDQERPLEKRLPCQSKHDIMK